MMKAVELQGVTRIYRGSRRGVSEVNLQIEPGTVYGLLGRNGSGKTTLIKLMVGLLRPDTGTVRIGGFDPFSATGDERERLGYMSEQQILPDSRVDRLVGLCASLCGRWNEPQVRGLLSKFGIGPRQRVTQLSLGQQRILAFALAIGQRPDVLVLDEPAANLDVHARREILAEILAATRSADAAVVMSSHVMSDVERVAERVGFVRDGRLILDAPLDDLKEGVRRVRFYQVKGVDPSECVRPIRVRRAGDEVWVTARLADGEAAEIAARAGCKCEEHSLGLEELFVDVTAEEDK